MRKITGMVLCAMLMLYSAVVIPVSAESENIFLNKNVTSSINASNAVLSIDKMVDGDRNTRFATPGNQTVPLEITIDLGGMYDVSKVVVTERLDKGFTCCDNLKIEVGTKNKWASLWTTAVEGESLNDAGTVAGQEFKIANSFEFDAICGNVVRLTLARSDRTPVQYQLVEIEGYGTLNTDSGDTDLDNLALGSKISANIPAGNAALSLSKINDGDYTTRYASSVAHTDKELVVTVDLGAIYKISYIGVLERWVSKTCSDTTNIDVGLSTENTVLWKRIVEGKSLKSAAKDGQVVTNDFIFSPVYGDQLRITFDRANKDYVQYQLNELIILGSEATGIHYEIGETYLTREGERIDELTAGDAAVNVSFPYMINEDNSGKELLLLGGIYDKKTNEQKFCVSQVVTLGQDKEVTIPFVAGNGWNNSEIKVFLWDKDEIFGADTGETFAVDFDLASGTVKAKGEFSGISEKTSAIILALNPDCLPETVSAENFGNMVNYCAPISIREDGGFTYSYTMTGSAGKYQTYVLRDDTKGVYAAEKTFMYYSESDLAKIADEFDKAQNAEKVSELLETYETIFPVESAGEREAVAEYILCEIAMNGKLGSYANLQNTYKTALVFYQLSQAENADEFREIMEDNSKILPFTRLNSYKAYQDILNKEQKNSVLSALVEAKAKHMSAYEDIFSERTILTAVEVMSNWRLLEGVLSDNRNSLKTDSYAIDYETYDSMCKKYTNSAVDKQIVGNTYSSYKELCDAVNAAIKAANKSDGKNTGSGGSGGSGGKGGPNGTIAVVPTVTPSEIPEIKDNDMKDAQFEDMKSAEWASEAVNYLKNQGILNGKTDREFAPQDMVTREEFIKMIVMAAKISDKDTDIDFRDVKSDDWFYPYVKSAYANGIVLGKDGDVFGTGENITREDMAVILSRAFTDLDKEAAETADFADINEISEYALASVRNLAGLGIINGMGDGRFAPKSNATRAQAAVMLYNAIGHREGK